jgi:crotonobetainyl-CoA:carnitine CoA-transferase CaiB-like acyl-CoA transferase
LVGIRVLDLSRVLAGPYCSMVLSDYGAEVIKVERPGSGDDTRQWGPPWVGSESAYFLSVNRNKKSVTLDLKRPEGAQMARRLAGRSDVLIENFKPGAADRMGLGYDDLAADNPGLVYCSISGYGRTGPYRDRPGYDFMIQAQGGVMSITGPADGEPHKVGVAIVDVSAGLFAATAVLAALHSRNETGSGQHIDVALLDSQVAWLSNVAQNYLATGDPPERHGNAHPNIVPYEAFPTADGQIALAVGNNSQFERFCSAVGRPDLWADERFRTNSLRVMHRVLVPELQRLFETRATSEWLEVLLAAAIPASAINDIPSVLADPQVRARDMVQTAEHDTLGEIELVGPVAKFSATPAAVRTAPPVLGADTRAVLGELLGCDTAELDELERRGVIQVSGDAPVDAT